MNVYDLCLAWEWQYDADFVNILQSACNHYGLNLLQITPDNIVDILPALNVGDISYRAFLDRASDVDTRFMALVELSCGQDIYYFNRFALARRAWDKASMHARLTHAGLQTPTTIVLPPFNLAPNLKPPDLSRLGEVFSIKPAHGGGGRGVIPIATSWDQVLSARCEFPKDSYLVQAYIHPAQLDHRLGWFRVIYCCGQVFPCWWDTCTHVYTPVSPAETDIYSLAALDGIMQTIASISRLELFSTEIACTEDGDFVIIDYINDPIDLRLQSAAFEGVPDYLVVEIADRLAAHVALLPVPRFHTVQLSFTSISY